MGSPIEIKVNKDDSHTTQIYKISFHLLYEYNALFGLPFGVESKRVLVCSTGNLQKINNMYF